MDEEFDDTKYSSIYDMRICATVKGMKNSGYSLEKCLEYFNEVVSTPCVPNLELIASAVSCVFVFR